MPDWRRLDRAAENRLPARRGGANDTRRARVRHSKRPVWRIFNR